MCGGVMWCPVTSAWNLLPKYFSGAGEIPQWIKFLPWKNMDMSWIPGTHKNVRVCFWSHVNVRVGETGARKSLELSLAYIVNSGQLEILCQKIHHMCVCVCVKILFMTKHKCFYMTIFWNSIFDYWNASLYQNRETNCLSFLLCYFPFSRDPDQGQTCFSKSFIVNLKRNLSSYILICVLNINWSVREAESRI